MVYGLGTCLGKSFCFVRSPIHAVCTAGPSYHHLHQHLTRIHAIGVPHQELVLSPLSCQGATVWPVVQGATLSRGPLCGWVCVFNLSAINLFPAALSPVTCFENYESAGMCGSSVGLISTLTQCCELQSANAYTIDDGRCVQCHNSECMHVNYFNSQWLVDQ